MVLEQLVADTEVGKTSRKTCLDQQTAPVYTTQFFLSDECWYGIGICSGLHHTTWERTIQLVSAPTPITFPLYSPSIASELFL